MAPPVPQYNWEDELPKIPPYMGGDEPPPLKLNDREYSVLHREDRSVSINNNLLEYQGILCSVIAKK